MPEEPLEYFPYPEFAATKGPNGVNWGVNGFSPQATAALPCSNVLNGDSHALPMLLWFWMIYSSLLSSPSLHGLWATGAPVNHRNLNRYIMVSIIASSARNIDTGPGKDLEANLQGILNVFDSCGRAVYFLPPSWRSLCLKYLIPRVITDYSNQIIFIGTQ